MKIHFRWLINIDFGYIIHSKIHYLTPFFRGDENSIDTEKYLLLVSSKIIFSKLQTTNYKITHLAMQNSHTVRHGCKTKGNLPITPWIYCVNVTYC